MRVHSVSAFYHDSAATLIEDGRIGTVSVYALAAIIKKRLHLEASLYTIPTDFEHHRFGKGRFVRRLLNPDGSVAD